MKQSKLVYDKYDKSVDTIETVKGLSEAIREFLESLSLPFDGYSVDIRKFEFKSRDGFSAHSHNRGGLDLFTETSIRYLISGGEHHGLKCEQFVQESYDADYEQVRKDNPSIDWNTDKGAEELLDKVDEYMDSEYGAVAWRVRCMYEGQGVLRVYCGYDTDAPYYRWNDKANFETEIKFKTISGLKRQLKALVKKIEGAQ